MTIREAHKTGVGPKIVFLFGGSWTRRKPHERDVDVDGEERRNMRQAAGGRAGARFSRPPEQPLAPEVASASSGHLGHQVTNNGGLECLELTITRHTKQAGMGIWGSVAGQASSLSLESLAPLPKGKKKNFGDFKHRSTKNLCERNELNKSLLSI